MSDLQLDHVSKQFGTTDVISDVEFEAADGEFVVFVGPSGCGKSTLLRLITGLESVSSGRIFIGGRDVTWQKPSRRGVAMVFQSYALFPHMTVAGNIGFGLKLAKLPAAEISRRVEDVARILQVEELLERRPGQLSGGQRQRVAIGRSIIRNPEVFLFDEPLSNLDAALRVMMRLEIARLHKRLGTTMVYVTHDQTEAMTLADRIVVINRGRIEQVGPPMELYERPANRFVAGFIGSPAMNFVKVELQPGAALQAGEVGLAPGGRLRQHGEATEIGIRPEHLVLAGPEDGDFPATVEIVEKLGAESLVYLQTAMSDTPLTMRVSPEHRPQVGDRIHARLNRDHLHMFDRSGGVLE